MDINKLIQEAHRELSMRVNLYPKWVLSGKLNQHIANERIQLMKEIVNILKDIKTSEIEKDESK